MLKVLKKIPIQLNIPKSSKNIFSQGINPRFIRTVLEFNGSMTKFVMNLSSETKKPLIRIIAEKEIKLCHFGNQDQKRDHKQKDSLINLQAVFNKQKMNSDILIQRSISFNLVNQQQPQKEKLLYFARSFWNKQKYSQIMQKNKEKPIGLNLIEQKIQLFRQLNWTGVCDIQIAENFGKNQETKIYNNLYSRSYTMLNHGIALCELQQFFLPEMFDIFTKQ